MHDYFQKVSSDIYLMDRGHFLETNNVFSPPPKMVVRQTPKLKVDIFTNHYSFVVFYVFWISSTSPATAPGSSSFAKDK